MDHGPEDFGQKNRQAADDDGNVSGLAKLFATILTNGRQMLIQHLNLGALTRCALIFAPFFFAPISHSAEPSLFRLAGSLNDSTIFTSQRVQGGNKVTANIYRINPGQPRAGLTYVTIEATSTNNSPHVAIIKQFGESYKIYQEQTPKDALAAINGGFFGYSSTGVQMPLGLVVADGRRENSRIGWTRGGVFAHSKNGASKIVPIGRYIYRNTDTDAIQSKPLLVEDSRNGIYSDDGERFNRTAIAITKSGKIIFAGAFDSFGRGVSLYEMAEFLLATKGHDGSTVRWALAMDGGPGAQLYIPSLKMNFGDQGKNYVPNFLYLK